jgi:hypothetical protein
MKANELRIGNLYDNNGNYFVVTPRTIESVFESERVWCKPIPLTEDILLKCGFSKWNSKHTFKLKVGEDATQKSMYLTLYGWEDENDNYYTFNWWINSIYQFKDLKFLHQLQNLYFALTGEELNINL